ncbi:GDYXXLXY domain-containing protein [Cupriavidus sp. 2KB_3]|uniref:GDYXXLXY domain-containing protein n=1 Tax=Cupriavidus TaxID=106589 RepID=UPI0011ED3998|nr:GDYXXLXY domain-containing protein [Cupriavidus campinensis]
MKRWIVVAWLLVIGVAGAVIVGKERVLSHGEVVYLRLAPVDPRSLMQGDYMALNFAIGLEIAAAQASAQSPRERETEVVIRRDAAGVGQLVRLQNGQPLAEGERRLRVQNVPSRWGGPIVQVSTDAWFFQEGQAERFAKARYGEFRLDSSGQALLVGMRDEQLQPL